MKNITVRFVLRTDIERNMRWSFIKRRMGIIFISMVLVGSVGCVSTNKDGFSNHLEKVDMSDFTIDQFKQQNECETTSQCKWVLYGKGRCNPFKGYLIYSTAIGIKNEKYLIDEVERNRKEEILAEKSSTEMEEFCLPTFPIPPLLFCEPSSETCVDAFKIMSDQENEIYRLRKELGIEE